MIMSTILDERVGPHLATVAKDEKRVMPTVDFDENRHVYYVRYGESENNSGPMITAKGQSGGGTGVVMTSSKISKWSNQPEKWYSY